MRKFDKGIDKVIARVYNMVTVAKYDSLRKLERNRILREYADAHPELSLKEIGQTFNISTSRVSRIRKKGKGIQRQEVKDG